MLPHVIVAVDLGTEFTKACYALKGPDNCSYDASEMVRWRVTDNVDIVPTAVTKKATGSTYGWEALSDGESMMYKTTFTSLKLALLHNDANMYAIGDTAYDNATNVADLTVEFFGYIFAEVRNCVQPTLVKRHSVDWLHAQIHLVLSVPAAGNKDSRDNYWKALKDAARVAGFFASNHTIIGNMTEPEAAARYVLPRLADIGDVGYKSSDTCILVDVGGGTADICAFYLDDVKSSSVTPAGVRPIRGVNIGGVMVNKYLEVNLASYFAGHGNLLQSHVLSVDAARIFAWGESARNVKVKAGQASTLEKLELQGGVPIFIGTPDIPEENGIALAGGKVQFSRDFLNTCLDHQIFGDGNPDSRGIWGLIGSTIDDVYVSGTRLHHPLDDRQLKDEVASPSFEAVTTDPVNIDHIILTGGFGSQEYVKNAIEAAVRRDAHIAEAKQTGTPKYTNLSGVRVQTVDRPQTSVVEGLLYTYKEELLAQAVDGHSDKKRSHIAKAVVQAVSRRLVDMESALMPFALLFRIRPGKASKV